jgi:hypothetical protein|tara:strand:- start:263 stop:535 length:273 start_codon:yes stop_codon:yes gene_type:complete
MTKPNKEKSNGGMYIYEEPRTGELFHYSRRGSHRKKGRLLLFKGKAHILNRVEYSHGDEEAGYPPNCNEGYHEEDGKCVPTLNNKETNNS